MTGAAGPPAALPLTHALVGTGGDGAPEVTESGGTMAPDPIVEDGAPADTAADDPSLAAEGGAVVPAEDSADAEAASADVALATAETGGMADDEGAAAAEPAAEHDGDD